MAKKNYTQAGARRAMQAARMKVAKVWEDGHMSDQLFIQIRSKLRQVENKLK